MNSNNYHRYILTGIGLMVGGWLLVFLITLRIINSTFLLNFTGYILATCGLFSGFLGIFMGRKNNENENIQEERSNGDNYSYYKRE